MSKADSFVAAYKEYRRSIRTPPEAPHFHQHWPGGGCKVAWVNESGECAIELRGPLDQDQAIEFAHWILDTFSEPEGSK